SYSKNSDSYGLAREFKNRNLQKNNETTAAIDYAKPLKHSQKIGFGTKAIFRQNEANYGNYLLDSTSSVYQINPALSNEFTYQQGIYAAYGEYSVEIKKWTIKPGVRVEHTRVNGDFRTSDTLIRFQYTNLIPAFSVIYKMNPTQNLKLAYNKRLQRPGLWYLNPFVDNSNPLFVSTGNPYLLPEIAHTIDLGFSKFGNFGNLNVSVYQNIQTQGISNFTTFNAEKGSSFTSYYNIGRTYGTGLSVNVSGKVGKKFSYFVNSSAEYQTYLSTFNNIKYKNSGIMGNGYASATYQLPKDFRIQANGNLWSGDVNIQGRNGMWYQYGLGAGKSFFKKKLTLTVSVNNFVQKNLRSVSISKDPNFEGRSENLQPARALRFSLNYNFGDLKEQVSRKKGVSNDDAKSGGSKKG
ncbi:MAG: outer membrane beta-barrel family protein, partial [Bacteroidia bacterium]